MTAQEFTATLAHINEGETEAANILAAVHQSISAARKMNEATRVGQARIGEITEQLKPLKIAVQEYVNAMNQAKAAEAHAKAKEAAEAAALLPQPKSEVELLREQMAELTKALAAKG